MPILKASCSNCQAVYSIKPEFLGKKTVCKNCGRAFVIAAVPVAVPDQVPADGAELPLAAGVELDEFLTIPETAAETPAPAAPKISASPAAFLQSEGKRLILALAAAAVAGGLVGAGLMGFARQAEMASLRAAADQARTELAASGRPEPRLADLQQERERLRDETDKILAAANAYLPGSVPRALAAAAATEYKIADLLLVQKIAALTTSPDPKMAAAVEAEMAALKADIDARRREAESLPDEARALAQTGIATQEINLALLNRNRLIARYGLNSPLPLKALSASDEGAAGAAAGE